MFFENIFKQLEKRKIHYLVIGGVAVNLHGYSRATGDLDIMLSFDAENLRGFIQMVKFLGWRPRAPVKIDDFADAGKRNYWIKEKNMKVFTIYNPKNAEQLDIMITQDISFENAYKRREEVTAGKLKIPVMGLDDLIQLKKIAGRGRDTLDIGALKEIKRLKNEKKKKR